MARGESYVAEGLSLEGLSRKECVTLGRIGGGDTSMRKGTWSYLPLSPQCLWLVCVKGAESFLCSRDG